MVRYVLRIAAVATLGAGLGLVACGGGSSTPSQPAGPTAADAKAFVEKADAELLDLSRRLSQAQWVSSNFITTDTEAISANTYQQFIAATMKMAKDAARFDARAGRRRHEAAARAVQAGQHPAAGAVRSGQAGRADQARRRPRSRLRPRQVLPARQALPGHQRHQQDDGDEPQRGRAARRVARLARHRPADEAALRALRHARQRRREGAGLQGSRRAVAGRLRHDAGRVLGRGRPAVDAGEAALRRAARARAALAAEEVRPRGGAGRWPDPGAPARQHLGAAVGQRLRPDGRAEPRPRLRPDQAARGEEDRRQGHGPVRRPLLHVARLRADAADVLGALAVHQAAGPRRRLPRQRLGRRPGSGPAHQDVHRDHRRGLRRDPPRAGPQHLPARLPASCR